MAGIEFKPGMKKDELLEIAALNGIEADDSMTKTQIMDALKAAERHNRRTARKRPAERRRRRRNVRAG